MSETFKIPNLPELPAEDPKHIQETNDRAIKNRTTVMLAGIAATGALLLANSGEQEPQKAEPAQTEQAAEQVHEVKSTNPDDYVSPEGKPINAIYEGQAAANGTIRLDAVNSIPTSVVDPDAPVVTLDTPKQ